MFIYFMTKWLYVPPPMMEGIKTSSTVHFFKTFLKRFSIRNTLVVLFKTGGVRENLTLTTRTTTNMPPWCVYDKKKNITKNPNYYYNIYSFLLWNLKFTKHKLLSINKFKVNRVEMKDVKRQNNTLVQQNYIYYKHTKFRLLNSSINKYKTLKKVKTW